MSIIVKAGGLTQVQLDFQTLTAAAGYTSAANAIVANAYRKLILEFQGSISGGSSVGLRINGDTGNNYVSIANSDPASGAGFVAGAIVNQEALITGFARIAFANTAGASPASGGFTVELSPLKRGSSGRRWGKCSSMMYAHTGNPASMRNFQGQFAWNDAASDITQVGFVNTGAETFTGDVYLYGIPL